MHESNGEHIGHCHRSDGTYRGQTADGFHSLSASVHVAFRLRNSVGAQDMNLCEAQRLVYAFPYRRFDVALPIRIDPEPCAAVALRKILDTTRAPRT